MRNGKSKGKYKKKTKTKRNKNKNKNKKTIKDSWILKPNTSELSRL